MSTVIACVTAQEERDPRALFSRIWVAFVKVDRDAAYSYLNALILPCMSFEEYALSLAESPDELCGYITCLLPKWVELVYQSQVTPEHWQEKLYEAHQLGCRPPGYIQIVPCQENDDAVRGRGCSGMAMIVPASALSLQERQTYGYPTAQYFKRCPHCGEKHAFFGGA